MYTTRCNYVQHEPAIKMSIFQELRSELLNNLLKKVQCSGTLFNVFAQNSLVSDYYSQLFDLILIDLGCNFRRKISSIMTKEKF